MRRILVIDPTACSGCRTCEMACSLFHEGECNSEKARIKVVKNESRGIFTPVTCIHCEKALCVDVCPMRALETDPKTGAIILNDKTCIGCKLCAYICPLGAPIFDPEKNAMVKCDLCGGDPQCAKFCAIKAIQYISAKRLPTFLKRKGADKLMSFQALMMRVE